MLTAHRSRKAAPAEERLDRLASLLRRLRSSRRSLDLAALDRAADLLEAALSPVPVRERALAAFKALETAEHGYVALWTLRRALPGVPREAVDVALLELQAVDELYLVRLNDPRGLAPEDLAACVADPIRGRLGFVSRGGRFGAGAVSVPHVAAVGG